MVTSLWQVPGEQLGEFIDSPEQVDKFLTGLDDEGCYLDKSIDGIQFLLDRAGVPVYLAPTDMPGEPIDVDGEIYFGLWVDLVKQIAENLRANSFDVLAPHFDSEEMNRAEVYPTPWGAEDDLDYLREHYNSLVQFFDRAATANVAVLLTSG